ncbi:unnamed protein product [Rangifer tarandus platyrhynchus]|uniref:Uncharacterized protein n=1 Tax=Rangifer tarandus platyrhynchus TaxID=3082113 RepID=A0AC59ZNJ5_RANTA
MGWGRHRPGQTVQVMGGRVRRKQGLHGHVSNEGCLLKAGSVDRWGARTRTAVPEATVSSITNLGFPAPCSGETGDTRRLEGSLFLMTSAFCGHCLTSAEVYDLGEVGSGVHLLQHSPAPVSFCKMGSGSFCAAQSQQR